MPSNRGKKGCKAKQIRKGQANKKAQPALEYAEQQEHEQPTHITFLAGVVRRSYRCGQDFPVKIEHRQTTLN